MTRLVLAALAALALAACSDNPVLPVEQLMDPETCASCHPNHTREWKSSMHAYAADDPVFLALNRQGQEETNGALGSFCVNCHAPMAVSLGLTTDGLNLADVPQFAKGVTCYFCHNAVDVEGTHNAPIRLARDQTMRGGLRNPVENTAHRSSFSPLLDAESPASSSLCGSCHDFVNAGGVHLERSFAEWQGSVFADPDPRKHLSCGSCHMIATDGVVAEGPGLDVPFRPFGVREHTFAAVDVALTPWPDMQLQQAAIDRDLLAVLQARLCVLPTDGGRIDYRLDNIGAGHMFPSGATVDRRAWVELVAYDAAGAVLFQSGVIPPSEPFLDPEDLGDPHLWMLGTPSFDADGNPESRFWRIARMEHPGTLLPPAVTNDPQDPRFYHAVERSYPAPGLVGRIARVTARVLLRPIPMHLVEELLDSGHLTLDVRPAIPTHVVGSSVLEWTNAGGNAGCTP